MASKRSFESFYVLVPARGSESDTEFFKSDPITRGEAPKCEICDRFLGMRRWMSPRHAQVVVHGQHSGDFAFGSSSDFLISEAVVSAIRDAGLTGINNVEEVKISWTLGAEPAEPHRYFYGEMARGGQRMHLAYGFNPTTAAGSQPRHARSCSATSPDHHRPQKRVAQQSPSGGPPRSAPVVSHPPRTMSTHQRRSLTGERVRMRDFENVRVVRGVTHVVAPRDPQQGLRLSEAELPLMPAVVDILSAHVAGGLSDSQARATSFADRRDDRPCGAFAKLLGQRPRLVDVSQQLAAALYAIAEEDERVTDGTLAVLLCPATDAAGAKIRFPAVLKLDPSATLHTVTDTDDDGKLRIRYDVDPNSLPSKNERVQKCAFVREIEADAEYEMLVVDRQRRGETVSKFWLQSFLGAEAVLDAPERTKRLYRSLRTARNEVEQDLDAAQLAALDQVIDGAVVQASVNLDTLVATLPVPEQIRIRMNATISRSLPDREFDLDQGIASQFVRRRSYRADHGLRISVDAEHADMLTVEDLEPGDDDTKLRRVSFETRTWKET